MNSKVKTKIRTDKTDKFRKSINHNIIGQLYLKFKKMSFMRDNISSCCSELHCSATQPSLEKRLSCCFLFRPPLHRTKTSLLYVKSISAEFFCKSLAAQFSCSLLFRAMKDPISTFSLLTPFLPATASHYGLPFLTELQSSEEDSQDESPVESVPIRGKKASLVPLHSHCPCVVVCFPPTAVNNGHFCAMAEAG